VTDILTNDEISLLRSLEKKSRTIIGNFTHKRYDRLETKGYIKRSSQPPSTEDILYRSRTTSYLPRTRQAPTVVTAAHVTDGRTDQLALGPR